MGYYTNTYCDRCGKIWLSHLEDEAERICDICGSTLKIAPQEYFVPIGQYSYVSKEMEEKLINDLVLPSPNFDQYYFDHREEIHSQMAMEMDAILDNYKAKKEGRDKGNKYGVSCPYCHATNVQRISGMTKAGHIALFGIFGVGKAGKQWHCTHCGSDF